MRTLTDEAGNEIEVPDESELAALKAKAESAEKFEKELKDLEDRSAGLKSLREALKRKEDVIASTKAERDALAKEKNDLEERIKAKEGEKKEDDFEVISDEQLSNRVENQTINTLVKLELSREIASFTKEDQDKVKKYYDKLTAGEAVNLETVHSFIAEAKRVAFPDMQSRSVRGVSSGGHAPRSEEKPKGFGETEEGKAFAANMGLIIEPPKKN